MFYCLLNVIIGPQIQVSGNVQLRKRNSSSSAKNDFEIFMDILLFSWSAANDTKKGRNKVNKFHRTSFVHSFFAGETQIIHEKRQKMKLLLLHVLCPKSLWEWFQFHLLWAKNIKGVQFWARYTSHSRSFKIFFFLCCFTSFAPNLEF